MKNSLSDALLDYGRSNEGANWKIYESLEISINRHGLSQAERCMRVGLKVRRQPCEKFLITI